jgi:hypothetical protein
MIHDVIDLSRSPSPLPSPYIYTTPITLVGRHSRLPLTPTRRHRELSQYESDYYQSIQLFERVTSTHIDTPATPIIHFPVITKELVECVAKPCHADECPICMETLKLVDTFTTRCGHMFHGTCMLIHTQRNDSCPMCRGNLIR